METISYKLPEFEGPLDLLLFLVQKNKLNIYDIPITQLLEQYIAAIREWQQADLDVATEFLEMAARLVQIKSAMLLPKHEQEAEELRRELTGELIEYQMCQQAAQRLAAQNVGWDLFVRSPMEIEPDRVYSRFHPVSEIWDAYFAAVGRGKRRLPPPAKSFSGIVSRKIVSVASKIIFVLRRVYRGQTVQYNDLFANASSKSELVATFLAILELVKERRICVDGTDEDMHVKIRDRSHRHIQYQDTDTTERAEPAWK